MSGNIRLIYFWIKESMYGCLKNKEFNFTNNYKIHFDLDELTLSIQKNYDTTNVFDNIISHNINISSNLTAIVGDNGVGKTTLLKEINTILNKISRREYIEKSFIMMFEYESKIEYLTNGIGISVKNSENLKKRITPNRGYISNNFSYILMDNNLQIDGVDLMDSDNFSEEFADNIFVYYWDSILGISELKKNNHLFELSQKRLSINKSLLYEYMKIMFIYFINISEFKYNWNLYYSMLFKLKKKRNIPTDFIFKCLNKDNNDFVIYFYEEIFRELISYIRLKVDSGNLEIDIEHLINHINSYDIQVNVFHLPNNENNKNNLFYNLNNYDGLINLYDGLINLFKRKYNDYGVTLKINYRNTNAMRRFVLYLCGLLCNDDVENYFRGVIISIDEINSHINNYNVDNNIFELDPFKLVEIANHNKYAFNFFKYVEYIYTGMSSGEEKVLNLFSQLHFLMTMSEKGENTKSIQKNLLILIDEIDAFLHPEWQRKILYNILSIFKTFYGDYNIQTIFTTHSPIVLSDMPKDNCIFLKKHRENVEIVGIDDIEQTFGQSIYTLYKNAFFLEKGFIGEFSKNYIDELQKHIDGDNIKDLYEKKEEYIKCIDIIGEPIIRKIFKHKLHSRIIDFESKEKDLEDLIKQRDALTKKIDEIMRKKDN